MKQDTNVCFSTVEGKTGCKVEDVLVFFTGADHVPPLGFEGASLTFQHSPTDKFATASTCDPELRLPTCYGEDIDAFEEAMLKDNDGFGGV